MKHNGKTGATGRGVRRLIASGAIVAVSGSALVASGTLDVGAKANYTRDCFRGLAERRIERLNGALVDMGETPSGRGCWLAAADGGVFSFGDAAFYGSAAKLDLVSPIVAFASTPDGEGYWLVAADGGVFNFGDAGYYGSVGGSVRANPIVGMDVTKNGNGYRLTDSEGKVYRFAKVVKAAAKPASAAKASQANKDERKAARKAARKAQRKAERKAAMAGNRRSRS